MSESVPSAKPQFVSSHEIGQQLSELLGIRHLRDVTITFPLDGVVTAKAEFLVDRKVAESVITLCRDGEWRSRNA